MVDAGVYSQFISAVELQDVVLNSLTLSRYWKEKDFPSSPEVELKYRMKDPQLDGGVLYIECDFRIKATNQLSNERIFLTNFTYALIYNVKSEPSFGEEIKEMAQEFARVNALVHVWPYARELTSSLTVRMGMPALVIGTYKVNL